ncbi:MAG: hypothetical protein KZQ58_00770 [gamma proteobacterium symbiont of Bathyaustriella thionipta]|nr:hypothetical protein [gamma proteobacterium symbiont of Bathyaustriella thionipta]
MKLQIKEGLAKIPAQEKLVSAQVIPINKNIEQPTADKSDQVRDESELSPQQASGYAEEIKRLRRERDEALVLERKSSQQVDDMRRQLLDSGKLLKERDEALADERHGMQETAELRAQLKKLGDMLRSKEKQRETEQSELRQQLALQEQATTILEQKLEQVKAGKNSQHDPADKTQIRSLKEALAKVQNDYEDLENEYQEEHSAFERKLDSFRRQARLAEQKSNKTSAMLEKASKIETTSLSELESLKKQLEQFKQNQEIATQNLQQIEADSYNTHQALKKENAQLRKKAHASESAHQKLCDTAKKKFTDLKQALTDSEHSYAELQKEHEQLQKAGALPQQDNAASQEQVKQLQNELKNLQQQAEKAEKLLKASQQQAEKYRKDAAELRSVVETYVTQIQGSQNQDSEEIEALRAELKIVREMAANEISAVQKRLEQHGTTSASTADNNQLIALLKEELQSAKKNLSAQGEQFDEIKNELDEARYQHHEAEDARKQVEENLYKLREEVDEDRERDLRDTRLKTGSIVLDTSGPGVFSNISSLIFGALAGILGLLLILEVVSFSSGRGELFSRLLSGNTASVASSQLLAYEPPHLNTVNIRG